MYDNTNMNAVEEIILAKKLGRNGAYNGKQAPCQDGELMHLFIGTPVGSPHGMNLLAAWNESRHEELENSKEYQQMLDNEYGDE